MTLTETAESEAPTPDPSEVATAKRKVALVGFTISRDDAPWGDPEWEVWSCNNLWRFLKPEQVPTRHFDLHDLDTINADPEHVKWLESGTAPCMVLNPQPNWPSATPFPGRELVEFWRARGVAGYRYFTNTISWMIAYTIAQLLEGGDEPGEIALYGIDMAVGTEFSAQRPSCEYWLGMAEGMGLTVTVARRADLLKSAYLYGLDEDGDFAIKMRARTKELEARIVDANQRAEQHRMNLEMTRYEQHQLTGALESQRYIEGVWLMPEGTRKGGDDPYSTAPVMPVASDGQGSQ